MIMNLHDHEVDTAVHAASSYIVCIQLSFNTESTTPSTTDGKLYSYYQTCVLAIWLMHA